MASKSKKISISLNRLVYERMSDLSVVGNFSKDEVNWLRSHKFFQTANNFEFVRHDLQLSELNNLAHHLMTEMGCVFHVAPYEAAILAVFLNQSSIPIECPDKWLTQIKEGRVAYEIIRPFDAPIRISPKYGDIHDLTDNIFFCAPEPDLKPEVPTLNVIGLTSMPQVHAGELAFRGWYLILDDAPSYYAPFLHHWVVMENGVAQRAMTIHTGYLCSPDDRETAEVFATGLCDALFHPTVRARLCLIEHRAGTATIIDSIGLESSKEAPDLSVEKMVCLYKKRLALHWPRPEDKDKAE